ncbi:MAG: hypothetical protein HXY40_12225 [Chloroflexi bacterium]|nr:hypothetical protein [Chloroflexota bacterium]
MSQAEALYRLQMIDVALLQAQQRLKTIDAALSDDHQVAAARQAVAKAQQKLQPLRAQAHNLELEVQSNLSKTGVTEEQLYSGRVRNPKELQDMQQEIAALKKRKGELEDHLLAVMMEVEEAENHLAACEAQLKSAQSQQSGAEEQLLQEQAGVQEQVKTLQSQRSAALTHVTPESLKLYTALRPKKANQPVAVMKGNSCQTCGVEQEMAVAQQARQGQKLTFCTSCERILVYMG